VDERSGELPKREEQALKNTKAEYWAPKIHGEWRKSIEGILGVGRQLIAAKQACEHGEFLRLFKGHENAVSDPVPVGIRWADMLMAVASNPVLADWKHASNLPQSASTLYELTKLDDETLLAGIKSGEITPETTRAQAAALHADPVEKAGKPPHEEMADAVKNAITRLVGQLTTPQQFEYVRQRLAALLDFLSQQETEHGSRGSRQKTSAKRAG
jgi:hypothetical protein